MITKNMFLTIVNSHFNRIVGEKLTEGEVSNLIFSLSSELGLSLPGSDGGDDDDLTIGEKI